MSHAKKNWLDQLQVFILSVLLSIMVLSNGANVFFRYVINRPMPWGDEVVRLSFVWAAFLGAYAALRRKAHVGVSLLSDKLSPYGARQIYVGCTLLFVASFLGVVTFSGIKLVIHVIRVQQVTPALGISMAYGYLSIPTSTFLMFVEVLRQAYEQFSSVGKNVVARQPSKEV